jgi:hypothetical protein
MAAKGVRHQGHPVTSSSRVAAVAAVAFGALVALAGLEGCASHSEFLVPMRTALDDGRPRAALGLLDHAMGVKSDAELPSNLDSDRALYVLDRGSVQQSVAQFAASKRDLEAADKAVDQLDIAHDAGDTIGEYFFSGSSGRYRAPPHEKLLVNTLDMLNYLETRDLDGARVEARRLAVMQAYIRDDLHEEDSTVLGLGAFLAGFVFEKSDRPDEALRWYDQALEFTGFRTLRGPVQTLLARGQYRSPRLREIEGGMGVGVGAGAAPPVPGATPSPPEDANAANQGDLVFVVGYGRVPHKIARRIPIGLALTLYSGALSPGNAAVANRMAVQGLVTWINFPSLADDDDDAFDVPSASLDGRAVPLERAVDVDREVRAEWKKIEGRIIASAITRLAVRYAAGTAVDLAAGSHSLLGALLSIGTQVTLTALDTPDTRSWETLPARVAIARVRVPAGHHLVRLDARGFVRNAQIDVDKGGWAVVSLMGLR